MDHILFLTFSHLTLCSWDAAFCRSASLLLAATRHSVTHTCPVWHSHSSRDEQSHCHQVCFVLLFSPHAFSQTSHYLRVSLDTMLKNESAGLQSIWIPNCTNYCYIGLQKSCSNLHSFQNRRSVGQGTFMFLIGAGTVPWWWLVFSLQDKVGTSPSLEQKGVVQKSQPSSCSSRSKAPSLCRSSLALPGIDMLLFFCYSPDILSNSVCNSLVLNWTFIIFSIFISPS